MNLPARRTRENAVITGVCAGLARRWGVDANLLRIALIVLSFASGLGLVLYGVGYLVLKADDATPAPVHRLLPFTRDWPTPALVLALAAAGFVGFGLVGGWSGVGVLPVLVALGIWYSVSRRRGQPVTAPDPTPFERAAEAWRLRLLERQVTSGAELALPASASASYAMSLPPSPAPAEIVRRPRARKNRLWWLALSLMAVGCVAVALLTPSSGGYHIAGLGYLAVVLLSLGITLLVSTWHGRPRLMGTATVAVMIATVLTWGLQSPGVDFRVADTTQTFSTAAELPAEISATAGSLDLDFTTLALATDTTINLDLGAGDVVLRLPAKVNSVVTWDVGIGDVSLPGGESRDGTGLVGDLEHSVVDDAPTLRISVKLGVGSLEVRT